MIPISTPVKSRQTIPLTFLLVLGNFHSYFTLGLITSATFVTSLWFHIHAWEDSTFVLQYTYTVTFLSGRILSSSNTCHIFVSEDSTYWPPIHLIFMSKRILRIFLLLYLRGFYVLFSYTFHIFVERILHLVLQYISHLSLRGFYILSCSTFHIYVCERILVHIDLKYISHLCPRGFSYILLSNTFHIYVWEDSTNRPLIRFTCKFERILHNVL